MRSFNAFRVFWILLLLQISFPARNASGSGTWFTLANPAKAAVQLMILLPDGTVLAANNPNPTIGFVWYRLTPDPFGHYVLGDWSDIAPMHDARLYYSSDVLRDGRLFVAGGEYGPGGAKAEIYDPLFDTWTQINPPASLLDPTQQQAFLDSNSKLLPDGSVLIEPVQPGTNGSSLIYHPTSNSWSNITVPNSVNLDESSWVKLPDDSILTVQPDTSSSGRYIPSQGKWILDAPVPVNLWASLAPNFFGETGPAFLLPNGKAFFLGGSGHTAIYTPSGTTANGSWVAGPDIPSGQVTADAPGAMMPNGKILFAASPPPTLDSSNNPVFHAPTSFFEYDYSVGTTGAITQVSGPTGLADNVGSFVTAMLVLPDGSVLYANSTEQNFPATGAKLYVYAPDGPQVATGKPAITSITPNADGTFHLVGTGLNGISEGAAYGDDAQMNGNYPIVQFQDTNNNHIDYARTFNWSGTGVQTGGAVETTEFELPNGLVPQTYLLSVSANGLLSSPVVFSSVNPSSLALCPGDSGTLSIIPSPQPATYQWFLNNIAVPGQTNPSLNIVSATTNQAGIYTLKVTSGGGSVIGPPVPVSVGILEISQPPQTNVATLCQPKSLTVVARGKGTVTAQWFRNNNLIVPDSRVTETSSVQNGAITFNLIFANVVFQDDATYNVVLTDDCGPVSLPTFPLRVAPNPPWLVVATNGPPPRRAGAACYDSDRHVTVLCTGFFNSNSLPPFCDTWEFDGTNWAQRFPAASPPIRNFARMVYDSRRHRTVLFGGQIFTNSTLHLALDTWEWDGNNWQQIFTPHVPGWTFIDEFGACYDSAHGEMLIFGGEDNTGRLSELWAYDGTDWRKKTPAGQTPVRPSADLMAYDSARNVAVLLGANSQIPSSPYASAGAVWEWNGTNWQERIQSGQFFGGLQGGNMMTFDTFRGESVLYGDVFGVVDGVSSSSSGFPFPDGFRYIWRWNGQQWQADPPTPTPGAPNLQIDATLTFDSDRNGMLLFGGTDDGNAFVTNLTYEILYRDDPVVLKQPAAQLTFLGQSAQLSVLAAGAPPISYQWQKGVSPLSDTVNITGSTSNTLTIHTIGSSDTGTYQVALNNLCGAAMSQPVSLNAFGGQLIIGVTGGGGGQINLHWTNSAAVLQTAPELKGPWTTINGASNPYLVNPTNSRAFFRVIQ